MEERRGPITVPVKLDEKTFRRFAWFDMFFLRRQWTRPLVFFLILSAFAAAALFSGKEQSGLIAAVLLTVGLGVPLVWFGSFLSQVNAQALRAKLGEGRRVYTVTLEEDGLTVRNDRKDEGTLRLKWEETHRAFRNRGCVYLYVAPAKAFLLPGGQADAPDGVLWDFLVRHMGRDKCGKRKEEEK